MENKGSYPRCFILIQGTLGYVSLIGLGLVTNIFSREFAGQLATFILPIALFLMGATLVELTDDVVRSLVGHWRVRNK